MKNFWGAFADGAILFPLVADDLYCPEPIPAFDNSSMDGYAVKSSDLMHASEAAPIGLKIIGSVFAGDAPSSADALRIGSAAETGTAVEIMTGAPLPEAYDAVIKVEDAELI